MKTDALIELLVTGAGPAQRHPLALRFGPALAIGTGGVVSVFLAIFRINPALDEFVLMPGFWIKMAFAGTLTVAGLLAATRLARPGVIVGNAIWLGVLPVAALWAFALFELVTAEQDQRSHLMLGDTWTVCPFNIALLSVPMLTASIWAVRGLAPTDPHPTGAALGLFSGAFGACVYGLHCPELSPAFLSIWYVIGILIPSVVGYAIGPRVLRW